MARRRRFRALRWTFGLIGALVVVAVVGMVVWSQVGVMGAEPEPLAAGGVRACQLAEETDALVLFASYCSNDLSEADIPVLSLSGSEDGLSTPAKVDAARVRLPADADMVEIAGANHASFGAYGPQAGDGEATASDETVDAEITSEIGALAEALR